MFWPPGIAAEAAPGWRCAQGHVPSTALIHDCTHVHTPQACLHVDTRGGMHCHIHVSSRSYPGMVHTHMRPSRSCLRAHTSPHTHAQGCTQSSVYDCTPPALVHMTFVQTPASVHSRHTDMYTHMHQDPSHTCVHIAGCSHTHSWGTCIYVHTHMLLYYVYTLIHLHDLMPHTLPQPRPAGAEEAE